MKLTKCINGHFYDAEKFAACPQCSGNAVNTSDDDSVTMGYTSDMEAETFEPLNKNSFSEISDGVRLIKPPIGGMPGNLSNGEEITRPLDADPRKTGSGWEPNDDEKTIPIWFRDMDNQTNPNTEHDTNNTAPVQSDFRPVVGWLVCTEGKHKGQSFNLCHGKNFVGRNADMDVCLRNDLSVSRNRHAIIVYEPRERIFFAQPGESHELFYVNDSVVLSTTQLKARDRISIGDTTLVFVPFCGEEFTW